MNNSMDLMTILDRKPADDLPIIDLDKYRARVSRLDTVRVNGLVSQVIGLVVESSGPVTHVGDICQIKHQGERNALAIRAEVVGFKGDRVLLMPLGEMAGIKL